jgi:hypothetical protein
VLLLQCGLVSMSIAKTGQVETLVFKTERSVGAPQLSGGSILIEREEACIDSAETLAAAKESVVTTQLKFCPSGD